MTEKDLLWYWINNIDGLGRKTIAGIIDYFGNVEEAFHSSGEQIRFFFDNTRLKVDYEYFLKTRNIEIITDDYMRLLNNNISFIHRESDEYPVRLKNIPDAPYGLYLKGDLPDEDNISIAVIGARNSTYFGREMARIIAGQLAEYGVTIVSGLARGIDGMAHKGALESKGYTLGILGCGIDKVYPEENYQLFMQMEKTGGILSESNMGIKPCAGLFPQRNRLISGMADGILVVEAREKSGTFITVDQGLEQGREIFALPGRIMDAASAGCNNLIKMGAHIVTEATDILDFFGDKIEAKNIKSSQGRIRDIKNSLAPSEKIVYSVLSVEPKYIDDIIKETLMSPQDVCMYLNRMSVSGFINEPVRNYFSLKM